MTNGRRTERHQGVKRGVGGAWKGFLSGSRPASRKLLALAGIAPSFLTLWLILVPLDLQSLWPLLAVPVVLSAWIFFEVGTLLAAAGAFAVFIKAAPSSPLSGVLVLGAFIGLGLILGRSHRQQQQSHRRVLRSSLTDALTGLNNYGYFMDCLDREICRVARYSGAVTVVMFDIDHFKSFNDRFGHQAGNEALKAVGAVLRREKRESDLAARFGGEEFALLIPDDEEAGLETANRIRQAIGRLEIPIGGATVHITISGGVASYPRSAASREELLDQVDQLLYLSKRNGRNRVSSAPPRQRLAVMR